jgi:two-component system, cell cycle response regulator
MRAVAVPTACSTMRLSSRRALEPVSADDGNALRRIVIGLALLGATTFALLALAGKGASPVATIAFYGVLFAVAATTLLRGVAVRTERLPWLLLGGGLLAWSAGFLYWRVRYAHAASQPTPSLSDVLELGFYPIACVALLLLARARLHILSMAVFLDGAAAALSAACVGVLILAPPLDGVTDGPTGAVLTGLANPIGDLFLVALSVGFLAVRGARVGQAWLLIVAGGLVFAATDCISLYQSVAGTYTVGGPLDIGWMLGMMLIGSSAWRPVEARRVVEDGHHSILLPLVLGAVSLGVLTLDHFDRLHVVAVCAAALSLGVILWRLWLTFALSRALIAGSESKALTDTVTSLPNRRALMLDLEAALADDDAGQVRLLAIFDLDGFKQYNDTFGHPAGDLLLARVSDRLRAAAAEHGATAYRMGGDEFCVFGPGHAGPGPEAVVAWGADALSEPGESVPVTASGGAVVVDARTVDASAVLSEADERMYSAKRSRRASALAQTCAVLRAVQDAVDPELSRHASRVAVLAERVARRLGQSEPEARWIRYAAELHDVGKVASVAIVEKPAVLDSEEQDSLRGHTVVGEQIAESAPALAPVAPLIRSSHEHWDGGGYPDGLAADAIPLGAQIVSVCDAFDAMTYDRPYRRALPTEFALQELRAGAGSQFSPRVVEAFIASWTDAAQAHQLAAA